MVSSTAFPLLFPFSIRESGWMSFFRMDFAWIRILCSVSVAEMEPKGEWEGLEEVALSSMARARGH